MLGLDLVYLLRGRDAESAPCLIGRCAIYFAWSAGYVVKLNIECCIANAWGSLSESQLLRQLFDPRTLRVINVSKC
jgi:hypothetical protein